MTTAGRIFFDACTLRNFAVVGRLDLLEKQFSGRAAWTDGTEIEIRRSAQHSPQVQSLLGAHWLGSPVVVGELPPAAQQVDRLRRAIGGGVARPLEHLGEAQAIHALIGTDGIFATDDRKAADFARRKGIRTLDSSDLLRECFEAGLVGCPEAFEVLQLMARAGRGVAVPPGHMYVCPS